MRVKLFVKEALTLLLVAALIMTFVTSPVLASINFVDGSENYLCTQDSGKDVPRFEALTEGEVKPNSTVRDEGNLNNTNERSEFNGDDRCAIQLVIRVNNRISDAYTRLIGVIAKYDCEVVNMVSMAGEIIAVVVDVSSAEAPSLAREMRASGLSSYIEHRMKFQAQFVPNDPYWSLQWGPQKIEADWAWNTTIGGASVLVAVIDTGIDWDHPDLAANYVALGYDWVNNDTDPMDDEGHGTHCAGIIAAVINNSIGVAGLAQVRIMAEKGLDQYGEGYEDDLANAIIHAVDQGADILSLSWGSYGESELIHEAVKYAYDSGALVVAAAGDEATNNKLYPAAYDEVIAVTATDEYDNPASWTNFGEWVELAAPGVHIYSTIWNDDYTYMSGTSMSTPHVAGVAALVWSQFSNMALDWVRAQLRFTTDDLGDPGFDDYYGYGRINARRAVEQVPPDHDLLIMNWELPPTVKSGDTATINTTVLNFGTNDESDIAVQLLVNGSIVDSALISFLTSGSSITVNSLWNPTVEGVYNVTSYVVPVPDETITQNNLITEIVTVVAPPPEAFWILLATDPDEGVGTSLKAIYGQLYSNIIYFKVEHYRPWTTINDIDTGIFIDADQDPSTGLPDGFYPGQNTGIGADYVILVGWQATAMWKWDPIAEWWDLGNPISLAYLDAPDGSNVFVVGVVLASVETAGILDCAVSDVVSDWDWMPDAGYFTWFLIRYEHELTVLLETPQRLQPSETSLLNVTVYNAGLNNETNVDIQLLINGTEVASETLDELVSGTWYTINYSWTPTLEGIYNITAYAPPVPGENITANNIATRLVLVQVLPDIIVVNDDDGGSWVSGTSLHEFESALTALGYDYWVWNESSMGNPSLDFLTKFELVIWTCGDYWSGAVDPTDAATLESYLAQGGNILLEGEDIGYDHHADSFMVNVAHAIYQVDDTGALGLTLTDPTHPVTFGLPTSFTWLTYPPYDDGVSPTNGGAEVIQYTGTAWTAVTVFEGASNGSVVYYAFPLYCLAQSHGETLAANSISWLLGIRYEHELAVKLEAPDFLEPGDSSMLNATVYNRGLNTETDVDLFLSINGTVVNSITIPELLTGEFYTINYLWTPVVEAAYNLTAYASPVPGENITTNNFATRIVVVTPLRYILFDQTHGTDSITNYNTWVVSLTQRGYVVDTHTTGPIDSAVLAGYDVFVIAQAHDPYTSDELSAIQNFVVAGGGLLVIGDDQPYIYTDLTGFAGISWMSGGVSGITTDITPHKVTQGVSSVYLDAPVAMMTVTGLAQDLVRDTAGNIMLAVSEHLGRVIGFADEGSLWNYGIAREDNLLLANNMIDWLVIKYEHDLAVTLAAPSFLKPGGSSLLNATVHNPGLSNETDVELQLLINGTVVDSVVIPELLSASSYTLSHMWTPTVEATYNVTACAPPVLGEEITANNQESKLVEVFEMVIAVVLDSYGTDYASNTFWDYLNTNWATYGTRPIVIDYTSLNKENITLADIEATHADVLIISDAWSDTYKYGWEFSDSEIEAIKTYVLSGHGIIATSGTFDTWSAPNNQKLAELFGMDPTIWYNWGLNGEQKVTSGIFDLMTPRHEELWRNIPDPYLSDSLTTLNPTPSSDWTIQGVTTGWIEALSTDHYAAVITSEAITHKAVYFTCILEGDGQYNENNRQLFYNAIVWSSQVLVSPVANFTWTPPILKVGEPVTFDASASTPNGGTIVTYEWDFGDGGYSTGKIVTHTYDHAGTYTVTLNVTDSQGLWDIKQKQIQVVQPHGPKAEFIATPETAHTDENIKFNASASLPGWNGTHTMPITEYHWDFGDGNTTTTTTPIIYHSYKTAGNYYVRLTVYAPGATPETDSATHVVTVVSVPVGGYSLSISTYTMAKPSTLHIALIAILTVAFVVIRRKTPRKTR